jgi:hypothetical protein
MRRKPMRRKARLTILGPKELTRIRTHDHQEEDVFFVYVPSSAPSLLSSEEKLLSFTLANPNQL